jgi:hypothetical protein
MDAGVDLEREIVEQLGKIFLATGRRGHDELAASLGEDGAEALARFEDALEKNDIRWTNVDATHEHARRDLGDRERASPPCRAAVARASR